MLKKDGLDKKLSREMSALVDEKTRRVMQTGMIYHRVNIPGSKAEEPPCLG